MAAALTNTSTLVLNFTKHRHPSEERQRSLMLFYHYGNRICLKTFMFLHAIRRFKALRAHYRQNGLVTQSKLLAHCNNSFELMT